MCAISKGHIVNDTLPHVFGVSSRNSTSLERFTALVICSSVLIQVSDFIHVATTLHLFQTSSSAVMVSSSLVCVCVSIPNGFVCREHQL